MPTNVPKNVDKIILQKCSKALQAKYEKSYGYAEVTHIRIKSLSGKLKNFKIDPEKMKRRPVKVQEKVFRNENLSPNREARWNENLSFSTNVTTGHTLAFTKSVTSSSTLAVTGTAQFPVAGGTVTGGIQNTTNRSITTTNGKTYSSTKSTTETESRSFSMDVSPLTTLEVTLTKTTFETRVPFTAEVVVSGWVRIHIFVPLKKKKRTKKIVDNMSLQERTFKVSGFVSTTDATDLEMKFETFPIGMNFEPEEDIIDEVVESDDPNGVNLTASVPIAESEVSA